MNMFCYQCEQTAKGTGCNYLGVCGKTDRVAKLQDLLVGECKKLGSKAVQMKAKEEQSDFLDTMVLDALFTTVTNVNFDEEKIARMILEAKEQTGEKLSGVELNKLLGESETYSIEGQKTQYGDTVAGLQNLILYGLKGAAAYTHHAKALGKTDMEHQMEYHRVLDFLSKNPTDINALLGEALHVGKINYRAMELLDAANTEAYGKPEPTEVNTTAKAGKCIVVSGHDLKDLYELLVQTEGKGINIYTHGEMLPALAYPGLKKFKHLVGNIGSAWQNQKKEFDGFPGAILFTTNCIQEPKDSYKANVFTTGLVAWPGCVSIPSDPGGKKDFTPVIEKALALPGFTADEPEHKITIGFAADTVLSVANVVVDAVKSGALKHIFLIGGCDGAKPGRNYYTEFAEKVPADCVILTLACGKFRFNKLDFGKLGPLPRLLDMGQCNDAYSAIRVAVALAGVFNCGVNDLPLSIVLSWYEQKAVAILLTLLSLDVKGMRLGPSLPAFLTPDVLQVLIDKFDIKPTGNAEEDLKAILKV